MSITFADISEHQEAFDPVAYRRAGNEVIIVRVHNGYRPDKFMPGRVAAVRAVPFLAIGYYLYLAASRDAAGQAREACDTVGRVRDNEFLICDHEEGTGSQVARCEAALGVMDRHQGFPATLYASTSFFDEHLGGRARWRRPRWMASYLYSYSADMSQYPAGATFWQYSDRGHFAGLPGPVDASIFPGAAREFLPAVRSGAPLAPTPLPKGATMADLVAVLKANKAIELFVMDKDGTVWHTWQTGEGSGWAGAQAGKRNAAWYSLGAPGKK